MRPAIERPPMSALGHTRIGLSASPASGGPATVRLAPRAMRLTGFAGPRSSARQCRVHSLPCRRCRHGPFCGSTPAGSEADRRPRLDAGRSSIEVGISPSPAKPLRAFPCDGSTRARSIAADAYVARSWEGSTPAGRSWAMRKPAANDGGQTLGPLAAGPDRSPA